MQATLSNPGVHVSWREPLIASTTTALEYINYLKRLLSHRKMHYVLASLISDSLSAIKFFSHADNAVLSFKPVTAGTMEQ